MSWKGFHWALLAVDLFKIAAAFLLALPVAWERERSTRIMGLRTFPLVAVASCGYVLIAVAVVGAREDAQSRIIQGLMTGIGFIGGGAILKEGASVRGTATAASFWTAGALGALLSLTLSMKLLSFGPPSTFSPCASSRRLKSSLERRNHRTRPVQRPNRQLGLRSNNRWTEGSTWLRCIARVPPPNPQDRARKACSLKTA